MAQVVRDENRVTGILGQSSVDNVTPIPLTVNPSNGRLRIHAIGRTTDPLDPAILEPVKRDENRVTGMLAEASTNRLPIPLTVGTLGGLRIDNL